MAIVYLNEHQDTKDTQSLVEKEGRRCLTIAGDGGTVLCCEESVRQTVAELIRLDILVNNAAEQHPQDGIEHIPYQYFFILLYDEGCPAASPRRQRHH